MVLSEGWFIKKGDDLICSLKSAGSDEERDQAIFTFIEWMETRDSTDIPELDSNLEWLNCKNPLFFRDQLLGKLCILDFFTYCCINCMHILPDLEALEHLHSEKDGLVILGIHSAKFENEKSSTNILSGVLRYDIRHPVVNDSEAKLWHSLSVHCWPTLVVVSPEGKILLSLVGEGHRDTLLHFVGTALKYYKQKDKVKDHSIGISLVKDTLPQTSLSFPGKVSMDKRGERLVVADTGHHRLLVINKEGIILNAIGGGEKYEAGFVDGSFQEARFHSPQGIAIDKEKIYIADTENHAIRQIDLEKGTVTTITGNGKQGSDKEGGKSGISQSISSPWDVVIGPPPGPDNAEDGDVRDVLYIAMAGTHQIWAVYLQDSTWLKGSKRNFVSSQVKGTCLRFAGSGAEENRNNSYPHKAAFAQPSGISLAKEKPFRCLFVADSESSSVRTVDVASGATKALVGADRDPTIKVIDPAKKSCETLLGSGKPGLSSDQGGVQFDEPGGLCVSPDGQMLYVADTNNHAIRVIDLNTLSVSQLNIVEDSERTKGRAGAGESNKVSAVVKRLTSKRTPIISKEPVHVTGGSCLEVRLGISLPEGCYLTKGVTSPWQVMVYKLQEDKEVIQEQFDADPSSGSVPEDSFQALCKVHVPEDDWEPQTTTRIEAVIYFCEPSGTCRMECLVYEVPLYKTSGEGKKELQINHICKL
ncbi:NHL repeat-containing protein 2 [Stylophora pistillata]|uniref:NHL repeat-containing protein 2 n=1 Tax=Stylophora pistillata TaxID=50429 RepID=A0A2B4S568_STYPI|nr:NHL repeat-containing protein 2 [Stylophora pistillata]